MTTEMKKMRPIWFFVGLMLLAMGAVIAVTGIYYYFNPGSVKTVMADLHPNIWWGMVMVVAGGILFLTSRNATVE
jgi:hypothetical protein